MKHLKVLLSVTIALLFITAVGSKSYAAGWNLAGVGPKALAMGGAFRAVADDWSAMYWNPAGLAGQEMTLGLEAKFLRPQSTLTPNVIADPQGYSGYNNGVEFESASATYPTGSVAFVWPLEFYMSAGLAIFTPSGIGAEWDGLFLGPPDGYGREDLFQYPSVGWFSDISVIDIHPSFAYEIDDYWKIGVGLSLQYGSIELQSPKMIRNPLAPYPYHQLYIDGTLAGEGFGIGGNIGAIWNPIEEMKVGLTYRTPVNIMIEGESQQDLYLPMPQTGMMVSSSPDGEAEFPIPMEAGLGISYEVLEEQLTVAFDATWTNWGTVDEIVVKLDGYDPLGNPAQDTEMIMNYEDIFRLSIGFNYIYDYVWEIRGGYYFEPTPVPDETLRPTINDVNDKHNISLGLAYWVNEKLQFHAYYEYVFTDKKTITSVDLDGDAQWDNVAGEWQMNVHTIGVAFNMGF